MQCVYLTVDRHASVMDWASLQEGEAVKSGRQAVELLLNHALDHCLDEVKERLPIKYKIGERKKSVAISDFLNTRIYDFINENEKLCRGASRKPDFLNKHRTCDIMLDCALETYW